MDITGAPLGIGIELKVNPSTLVESRVKASSDLNVAPDVFWMTALASVMTLTFPVQLSAVRLHFAMKGILVL